MAEDVDVTVAALQLEIAVIRRQPLIEDLHDVDAAFVDNERARRLLAAMTGVALDAKGHAPIMNHLAIGIAIGVGIGAATGDIALWVGVGVAIGVALNAFDQRRKKKAT